MLHLRLRFAEQEKSEGGLRSWGGKTLLAAVLHPPTTTPSFLLSCYAVGTLSRGRGVAAGVRTPGWSTPTFGLPPSHL